MPERLRVAATHHKIISQWAVRRGPAGCERDSKGTASASNDRVKYYDLDVDGYHAPLNDGQIADLFAAGRLRKADPCRELGARAWRTLDEVFPLLKYDARGSVRSARARSEGLVTPSVLDRSDEAGDRIRPMTSALKAGWICFGLGMSVAWFFPFGHGFFSIAIITAVVAMCTHQVNRGLALLLTSVAGIAISILLFLTMVVGAVGLAAGPQIKQANADLKRMRIAQEQAANQFANVSRQFQSTAPAVNPARFAVSPSLQVNQTVANRQQAHQAALARVSEATRLAEADRAQRARNVREAERQRDAAHARDKEFERLQKSVEFWDKQVRDYRSAGRDWRWVDEQRDAALRQREEARRR